MDNIIDLSSEPIYSNLINEFQKSYDHDFDSFQLHAFNTIEQDSNILVSVPTSCGKTIVAEFGIYWSMNKNKRSIYTSPIKTLSNQKFHDLKKRFGSENVGIITGDIKFNPDAKCIIMTTEILKYMLVKHDPIITETGVIVFDEVHYINNDDRGHIWEECIVLLPNEITMVMLSATINKPEMFVSWLNSIKIKQTFLVNHNNRPVPLTHYIVSNNDLVPIYKNGLLNSQNYQSVCGKFKSVDERLGIHKIEDIIRQNNLYPVLIFVFSRHKCEQYANMITSSFNDDETKSRIELEVTHLLKQYQYNYEVLTNLPQIKHIIKLATNGVCYHHSGLLPICKEIIEVLFSKNYIKLLFVTETFSVGVNMPTKSVIFVDLSKCVNGQHRYLYTDEYFQMSGRAGRRGKDTTGNVIYYPIKKILSYPDFKTIITGDLMTLHSRYQIDCVSVLNDINQTSDMVSKTYMYLELVKINLTNKSKLDNVVNEIGKLMTEISQMNISNQVVSLINQWKSLSTSTNQAVSTIALNPNFNFKTDPKKEKQMKNEKAKIRKELVSNGVMNQNGTFVANYQEYVLKIDEVSKLTEQSDKLKCLIENFDSSIIDRYQLAMDQLVQMDYIDNNKNLKTNGIFGSNITNVNGILVTELLNTDWFTKLEPMYIGLLLSILIIDNNHNVNEKNLSDLDVDDKLPTYKKYYQLMLHLISDVNKKFLLSSEIVTSIDLLDATYYWMNGENFENLSLILNGIEGNFVRSMLRLTRLCEEISKAIEIANKNIEILPKLEYISKSINRDIVVFDSIYIK